MAQPINIVEREGKSIWLTPEIRSRHFHVIGPPGSGKTRLFEHKIKQDILAGHGVCLIDPMGNLYKRILKFCLARGLQRRRIIHCFDPNSDDWIPSFNPLQKQEGEDVSKRVATMVNACARVWGEDKSKTPLLKRVLSSVFTSLVEHDLTLVEAMELIQPPTNTTEAEIQRHLSSQVSNRYIKRAWAGFNDLKLDRLDEKFSSANNRMMEFLSSDRMCRIFGYGSGSLDLQRCMDEGQILLVNLQADKISDDDGKLIGTLLFNEFLGIARARDNQVAEAHPFYCYVDEAYRYLNDDIEQALDETRQKGLHYILGHQRLSQLRERGDNIFGGVMSIQNKVVFGNLSTSECEEMTRELFLGAYDEDLEIQKMRKPVTVGHEIRRNRQWRKTTNDGVSAVKTDAQTRNVIDSNSSALNLPIDPFGAPLTGDFIDSGGAGSAKGKGRARAKAIGKNHSSGLTEGWAESTLPMLEERAGALRNFDDQMHIFARDLKALPQREVMLKLRDKLPIKAHVPYVGDPVARNERLPRFLAEAARRSGTSRSPQAVLDRLKQRRLELEGSSTQPVVEEELGFME